MEKHIAGGKMKKPKFLLKIDHNNCGKVYIKKKWLHDVRKVTIYGKPNDYTINVIQYLREDGHYVVSGGDILTKATIYKIGGQG